MSKIDPEYDERLQQIKVDIEVVRGRLDDLIRDIRREMSIATINRVVAMERVEKAVRDDDVPEGQESVFAGALLQWEAGVTYEAGDIREFGSKIWICQIAHTSEEQNTPDVAVGVWARYRQGGNVTQWVQPDGAGGPNMPYNTGDKVEHNDSIWVSLIDDNVREPGTDDTSWEEE